MHDERPIIRVSEDFLLIDLLAVIIIDHEKWVINILELINPLYHSGFPNSVETYLSPYRSFCILMEASSIGWLLSFLL